MEPKTFFVVMLTLMCVAYVSLVATAITLAVKVSGHDGFMLCIIPALFFFIAFLLSISLQFD